MILKTLCVTKPSLQRHKADVVVTVILAFQMALLIYIYVHMGQHAQSIITPDESAHNTTDGQPLGPIVKLLLG